MRPSGRRPRPVAVPGCPPGGLRWRRALGLGPLIRLESKDPAGRCLLAANSGEKCGLGGSDVAPFQLEPGTKSRVSGKKPIVRGILRRGRGISSLPHNVNPGGLRHGREILEAGERT